MDYYFNLKKALVRLLKRLLRSDPVRALAYRSLQCALHRGPSNGARPVRSAVQGKHHAQLSGTLQNLSEQVGLQHKGLLDVDVQLVLALGHDLLLLLRIVKSWLVNCTTI